MPSARSVLTLTEAAIADPAAAFLDLRKEGRVVWDEDTESWYVLDPELVRPLLRDDRLRARGVPAAVAHLPPSEREVIGPVEEFLGRWLVFSDPPKQTLLRRAIAPELTRVRHVTLAQSLPRAAAALAAAVAGRDGDLLNEVVRPLSRLAVREMLGLGAAQLLRVEELTEPVMRYLGSPGMDPERAAEAGVAISELVELTRRLTEDGGSGTAAALRRLRAADSGIDDLDVAAAYAQLITGALEPLTTAVAECLVAAARRPASARGDLVDFVESVLRTAAPFHFAPRVAKTAIELDGREIRPGQRVVLNLLAAGLQQCPVTGHSDAREHFAFGAGTHYCLGATMSRVHIAAVLPVLIRVGLPARIDLDRLVRRRSFGMSAFEQVPFTADGRTARPDDGAQEA